MNEGLYNTATRSYSAVGSGIGNVTLGESSTVIGGADNTAEDYDDVSGDNE